jgi:hypothetical protein
MILNVPVTASNLAEWVRRAATAINSLVSLQAASEKQAVAPTVDSVTFRPVPLPASPVVGMTVLDEADGVLKVYANGAWRALF